MPHVPLGRGGAHRAARRWMPLLLALTAGCRSWRAEPLPTTGATERAVRGQMRATRVDGTRIALTRARIAGDTLRGTPPSADGAQPAAIVAIPLDSVQRLERRRVDVARTVGLYFAVMGGVFIGTHAFGGAAGASRPR